MQNGTVHDPTESRSRFASCLMAVLLLLAAAGIFLPGLTWGLPSRKSDNLLFGDRPVWSGAKILALGGGWDQDSERAADVALHPISRNQPVWINETDAQKARIIRRYRLYSAQPDEASNFRALSQIHPAKGEFDPKYYQYGGLWIYPLGACIRLSSAVGYTTLTRDLAYYLDRPEAFGRFYVVARLYSAFWGLIGVLAVYSIARRMTRRARGGPSPAGPHPNPLPEGEGTQKNRDRSGFSGGAGDREAEVRSLWVSAAAAMCFATMPVVINAAHEAKPHLAGVALILLACRAAMKYADAGRLRWACVAGALCGAATGMVLTSWVAFAILPPMVLLSSPWRKSRAGARFGTLLLAVFCGVVVYVVTNPYVAINLVRNRALLRSNFSNTAAMYHAGGGNAIGNSLRLIFEGAGPADAVAGTLDLLAMLAVWLILKRRAASRRERQHDAAADKRAKSRIIFPAVMLLASCTLLALAQFILFAAGKPGEYGRFALLPDAVLALSAVLALDRLPGSHLRGLLLMLIVAGSAFCGFVYDWNYLQDSRDQGTRPRAAMILQKLDESQSRNMAIWSEPAPYCLPPVDLFHWRLILLPRGASAGEFRPLAKVFVSVGGLPEGLPPRLPADSGLQLMEIHPAHQSMLAWCDPVFRIAAATK